MTAFEQLLQDEAREIETVLDRLLPAHARPEGRLVDAMRYSTLGGGKRIRPFMVLKSCELFNVSRIGALRVGAVLELIHCYSLVHDDLPAMDDDDLRRGRPTCHIKFDEATAVLAGDSLLTLAFEVLANSDTHSDPTVIVELVLNLARAAGVEGMAGGQMLDLVAEHHALEIPEVTRLQRLKTGALIGFACEAGAIMGKAAEPVRHALHAYAHDLGLAFQIADDLLDVEGDAAVVGKKTQKDDAHGKATFVSLLGLERARAQAKMLTEQAIGHLDLFGAKADPLRRLARFVIERRA